MSMYRDARLDAIAATQAFYDRDNEALKALVKTTSRDELAVMALELAKLAANMAYAACEEDDALDVPTLLAALRSAAVHEPGE